MRSIRRTRSLLLLFVLAAGTSSCSGTPQYERGRVVDRSMTFDYDSSFVFIRHKTEAAREGSFGGFGAAAAGGCACQ